MYGKMRPLPETRSRGLNDGNPTQKVVNSKRLTNGTSPNHVTTRAQAKRCKNPTPSGLRRKLSSPPKVPISRGRGNANSKSNCTSTCWKNNNSRCLIGLARSRGVSALDVRVGRADRRTRDAVALNKNGLIEGKSSRGQLLSSFTHHRYQHGEFDSHGGPKTEKERVALHRAMAAEKRADRLKKRRSALWVLNCEAESFLFGETAAEKHEVELPPLASPPKKRRRMRTNELGNLLKESPILGSKLRSPPPTTAAISSDVQQPTKIEKSSCSSVTSQSELVDILNLNKVEDPLENSFCPDKFSSSMLEDELTSIASVQSAYSSLSSDACAAVFSDKTPNSQSVRIQNVLSSMTWKFSFEELPSEEVWYSTFKRQENPLTFFDLASVTKNQSSFSPVLLPYETKLLSYRSPAKRKCARLPRKSPRCHASTLAILSSLKRGRHRNFPQSPLPSISTNSVSLPLSPQPSPPISAPTPTTSTVALGSGVQRLGTELLPTKSKRSYKKRYLSSSGLSGLPGGSLDSFNPRSGVKFSTLAPVSPSMLPLPPTSLSSSQTSPSSPLPCLSPSRNRDLSATQYLWDSIQLLSDPYVIQVLAGERLVSPVSLKMNHIFSSHIKLYKDNYVNNCINVKNRPSNNISLQRNDVTSSAVVFSNSKVPCPKRFTKCCSRNTSNHLNGIKLQPISCCPGRNSSKNGEEIPSLKESPNSRNITNLNYKNRDVTHKNNVITSGGTSRSKSQDQSVNGRCRKASRSSPVVLVADIFKNGNSKLVSGAGVDGVTVGSSELQQLQHASSYNIGNNSNSSGGIGGGCKTGCREELLFLMEGIPPLPAWPV